MIAVLGAATAYGAPDYNGKALPGNLFPDTISWTESIQKMDGNQYQVQFTGKILEGWHSYSINDPDSPTELEFIDPQGYVLIGEASDSLNGNTFIIKQLIEVTGKKPVMRVNISWRSCKGEECRSPEDKEFSISLPSAKADKKSRRAGAAAAGGAAQNGAEQSNAAAAGEAAKNTATQNEASVWAMILEAILWGLAMLLTPCVFPMVPLTVSFFIKGSGSPRQGRAKALLYGLFIVLLYTLPICIIIGLTRLLGGGSVTADIFNWLSTHWLPNLLFFAVFMVFAASFFGAFEINLPSSWSNRADKNSNKKGLAGVFFLALTLVIVSFSCTGPIVGTVLIKSTQGEFWMPMVTMLAFSVAFALPFTLLAFFPSVLKKLPKSGGWLGNVKVVLGFIEIALGLKFLSTADQTYHWGILDREVYLAIWIVCFSLLGLYLMGKIRFKNDSPTEHLSVFRLVLVIAVFSFVVYLIPGMWGAPLKAISGYLPPLSTQDFVLKNADWQNGGGYGTYPAHDSAEGASGEGRTNSTGIAEDANNASNTGNADSGTTIRIAHSLVAYTDIDSGVKAAARSGKKVFVDITGHGCVNCREMEERVWSDPKVLRILKEDFVIVALYTDDKTKLPEYQWITTSKGRVLKDVGRVNSHIALERFGVNAQPNYIILDSTGRQISSPRGYNLDIQSFITFLQSTE